VSGLTADGVAVLHLAAVVFMLTGGLLGWRWPRLLWAHVPLSVAILAVNLAGDDCPLTDLELRLRAAAGLPPYTDGFIGHYLVTPLHPQGITPGVQVAIYVVAVAPNVLAYSVLIARRTRSRPRPRPPRRARPDARSSGATPRPASGRSGP